jgi:hypothetical protein
MKSVQSLLQKLRRPPAAHNWVKNIRRRRDETAFALHNFAMNPPRTSLLAATAICTQIVLDGISLEQAIKCADTIKDISSRERAKWIARAFHGECIKNDWRGIQIFAHMIEFYHVSAGVKVPVRPTFVVNDNGKLVPYFLICWSKMDLSEYQLRVLSTIIHEAILTLEEFYGSDAIVICTPVAGHSKRERHVRYWKVSEHELLSDSERQDLFDRYAGALDDAERMIIESLG